MTCVNVFVLLYKPYRRATNNHFRPFTPSVPLRCFTPLGLPGRGVPLVDGPVLALGFKGDRALCAAEVARVLVVATLPSVALRRLPGRNVVAPMFGEPGPNAAGVPMNDIAVSPRRDFSCLVCTARKCESRSCHLMVSFLPPMFERIVEAWPGLIRALWFSTEAEGVVTILTLPLESHGGTLMSSRSSDDFSVR